MIINNPELKKITQEIQKIIDAAVKDQERVNKIIEQFKKNDEARMKAAYILKAKRWELLKKMNLDLAEYEVVTDLKIKDGKLEATTEDLLVSWQKNFKKTQKEQDEHAAKVLKEANKK